MKHIPIAQVIKDKISGEWGEEPSGDNSVKVIRTANFTNLGVIDYTNIVLRNIDAKKVTQKQLLTGDIIIEKSGGSPTQPVGRVVYFENPDNSIYLCNNFTSVLRPNRSVVFPKYLFYILFYNHLTKKTLRYQNKTTGIINLQLDKYLNSNIPLPSLDDQIRIATIFTRVEKLIAKRKESIKVLDELLKSTFLEMFGDPLKSKNDWFFGPLGKKVDIKHGFAFLGEYFSDSGEFVLLTPGNFYEEGGYRDRGGKQKYYKGEIPDGYLLNQGDLLVAMTEQAVGLLGSPIIVPASNKYLHNQRLGLIISKENDINNLFLFHLFNHPNIRKTIHSTATGMKVRHTSPTKIENINVSVPPIALQNNFATIVTIVESLKTKYTQSLTELANLYGSLSQRAFKGELDLSKVPVDVIVKPEPTVVKSTVSSDIQVKIPKTVTDTNSYSEEILRQLIKTKSNQIFLFDELWQELTKMQYVNLPKKKEIQNNFIKDFLESAPPIVLQVFDIPTSKINDKKPLKQIAFKVNNEN